MKFRPFAISVRRYAFLVFVGVLSMSGAVDSRGLAAAQIDSQSDNERLLLLKEKRFTEYGVDFAAFAKPFSGPSMEYDATVALLTDAFQTTGELHSAFSLLEVYGALSCDQDREKVRPLVEREFRDYSVSIERTIRGTDLSIGALKSPGVATEGLRMRDDMREAKALLDSVKFR